MKHCLSIAIAMSLLICAPGRARDPDGRYAKLDPERKKWFESLQNQQGQPCCADADGAVLIDSDWEAVNNPAKPNTHYRVHIPIATAGSIMIGPPEWVDVPDEAVITKPNLDGRTIVWPLHGYLGTTIRCFIVGPLS